MQVWRTSDPGDSYLLIEFRVSTWLRGTWIVLLRLCACHDYGKEKVLTCTVQRSQAEEIDL